MASSIRFLGDRGIGEHLPGIPARDLGMAEYRALDPEQRRAVREGRGQGGPLYDWAGSRADDAGLIEGDPPPAAPAPEAAPAAPPPDEAAPAAPANPDGQPDGQSAGPPPAQAG